MQALLSGGDELLYTFNNTNFPILVPTDGDLTYNDLSSTNCYGIVTVIDNAEKYFMAQWAYHPEGNTYVGKYMKVTWKDNDGIFLMICIGLTTQSRKLLTLHPVEYHLIG